MPHHEQPSLPKARLASIDALRGFDMFWIIGGGTLFRSLTKVWPNPITETIRGQLSHVKWEGFQFQDLIWPLFLFIVGVVIPFSISRRVERGENRGRLFLHIFKRMVMLILLGLILRGLLRFDWPNMNWTSVLGRIGVCYFIAAVIVMYTGWRTQAVITGAILILYWLAMMLIPVPGYGAGILTFEGSFSSCVDRLLLPGGQAYRYFDHSVVILPTLTATCTVFLGVLTGHWLRSSFSGNRKAAVLAIAAAACLIVGYVWSWHFPLNKKLWTSSFVMYAGGWSMLLLAFFYWIIDVMEYKKWAFFFIVIGMNPITIYFLIRVVNFTGIAKYFLQGVLSYAGSFSTVGLLLGVLMVRWLLLWFLYRHKIFIKL
jgi:predicted acyltransferase